MASDTGRITTENQFPCQTLVRGVRGWVEPGPPERPPAPLSGSAKGLVMGHVVSVRPWARCISHARARPTSMSIFSVELHGDGPTREWRNSHFWPWVHSGSVANRGHTFSSHTLRFQTLQVLVALIPTSSCDHSLEEGELWSAILHNFTIFRDFPQLLFARPPCVPLRALCVPCAEVVLREAAGGLVTAPQFPPNFSQLDLTLPDRNPPPPPWSVA